MEEAKCFPDGTVIKTAKTWTCLVLLIIYHFAFRNPRTKMKCRPNKPYNGVLLFFEID